MAAGGPAAAPVPAQSQPLVVCIEQVEHATAMSPERRAALDAVVRDEGERGGETQRSLTSSDRASEACALTRSLSVTVRVRERETARAR